MTALNCLPVVPPQSPHCYLIRVGRGGFNRSDQIRSEGRRLELAPICQLTRRVRSDPHASGTAAHLRAWRPGDERCRCKSRRFRLQAEPALLVRQRQEVQEVLWGTPIGRFCLVSIIILICTSALCVSRLYGPFIFRGCIHGWLFQPKSARSKQQNDVNESSLVRWLAVTLCRYS